MTTEPAVNHELTELFHAARNAAARDGAVALDVREAAQHVERRIIPDGYKLHTADLEEYQPHPRRARNHVTMHRTDSFVTYVNRLASDSTVVYVDTDQRSILAVLNDHATEPRNDINLLDIIPGWGDHTVKLAWRSSLLWTLWVKSHGQWLDQEAFAELIEEGARAVVSPDAATLLEIATTFKAQKSSEIAIARRQQSGEVRFEWNETIDARAGRNDDPLQIPDRFHLRLTPFDGAEPVIVEARLRYRVENRQLRLGYLLDNPQQIIRDAVDTECAALTAALHPAVTVVHGVHA